MGKQHPQIDAPEFRAVSARKGLTQLDIAHRVRVHPNKVSALVRGGLPADEATRLRHRIEKTLKVRPGMLAPDLDDEAVERLLTDAEEKLQRVVVACEGSPSKPACVVAKAALAELAEAGVDENQDDEDQDDEGEV